MEGPTQAILVPTYNTFQNMHVMSLKKPTIPHAQN